MPMTKKDNKKIVNRSQEALNKRLKDFERDNPQVAGAMKIFEMGMSEYKKALSSLDPVKTYTSSSTIAKIT